MHLAFNISYHFQFCMVHLVMKGLLKEKGKSLITQYSLLVFVFYTVCGYILSGWHPGVACFDTYSRPKPTVCLPPTPQVSPSP